MYSNQANWGRNYELIKDSLMPKKEAVQEVLCVWIMGEGGIGKTRFINFFVQWALDMRVYKPLVSKDYK